MNINIRTLLFLILAAFLVSCSNNTATSPVSPDLSLATSIQSGHSCWGLWDIALDPITGTATSTPIRSASFNANVVRFLQPPGSPVNLITLSVQSGSDIPNGYWVLDITLRHPFPALPLFRGFDVRGIILAEGNATGIHDPGIKYFAPGDTYMLNPDGYTRWWNQQEFTTYGKIFGYTEGGRATPGFTSTSTLNPYKLFADELDKTAPLISLKDANRATFSTNPGINTRQYKIQFDLDGGTPPIRFKYAVDASWSLPDSSYAPQYPVEAYDFNANCQEPYLMMVGAFEEMPYYVDDSNNGGKAQFILTIGDWQTDQPHNMFSQLKHIWVESPTLLDSPVDILPSMKYIGFNNSTQANFRCTVYGCHPTALTGQRFLITAESANPDTYAPVIQGDPNAFDWPDAPLAAFAVVDVPISDEAPPITDEFWVVGLPDWCSLTEFCTSGGDNLNMITNLVKWDLDGPYNENKTVKWWDGHVIPQPPYSTSIIQSHVISLGYSFTRTTETVFDPTGCRMIIVNFVRSGNASYLPFTDVEVVGMKNFVKNGGVLCFLIENPNYFAPTEFDPLMDKLGIPLSYGGMAEPPSTTTNTTDITPHYLTTGVTTWQYWTCGEFTLESDKCKSLVRTATGEHIIVIAPIDVS